MKMNGGKSETIVHSPMSARCQDVRTLHVDPGKGPPAGHFASPEKNYLAKPHAGPPSLRGEGSRGSPDWGKTSSGIGRWGGQAGSQRVFLWLILFVNQKKPPPKKQALAGFGGRKNSGTGRQPLRIFSPQNTTPHTSLQNPCHHFFI